MACLKILVYLITVMTMMMMMKVLTRNSLPLQEWPVLARVEFQPGVHLQKCCQEVCELFISNFICLSVCTCMLSGKNRQSIERYMYMG